MKSLVYVKPNIIEWKEVSNPVIVKENDIIIKVEAFTFSHADYRPYLGIDDSVPKNLIMGHEAVGRVYKIGKSVKKFKINDRVVISSIIHCNNCKECKEQNYSNCKNGGFILGTKINGTHSEYARIPYGDENLIKINNKLPAEYAVMLSDVLSTAYDNVIAKINYYEPLQTAIIGDGPIGLATFLLLKLYNFKVDIYGHHENKMRIFLDNGAENIFINNNQKKYKLVVESVGNDRGTFEQAQDLLDQDGEIITIGVFSKPVTFYLNKFWSQNITIKTGILSASHLEILVKLLEQNKINVSSLISKIYSSNEVIEAYHEFTNKNNFKIVVKL